MRPGFAIALAAALVLLVAGCERPDRSYSTSPPMKTLLGSTTGNTAFNAPESAPEPAEPPADWLLEFGLARWTELENESPAIEIVMQVRTQQGAGMELWLTHDGQTVARWSGGSTAKLTGTVCFQLELQRDGEAVPLRTGAHQVTIAFREPGGEIIAARTLEVTNTLPRLDGSVPSRDSQVFREALACRRGQ